MTLEAHEHRGMRKGQVVKCAKQALARQKTPLFNVNPLMFSDRGMIVV